MGWGGGAAFLRVRECENGAPNFREGRRVAYIRGQVYGRATERAAQGAGWRYGASAGAGPNLAHELLEVWHQLWMAEHLSENVAVGLLPAQHAAHVQPRRFAVAGQRRANAGVAQRRLRPLLELWAVCVECGVGGLDLLRAEHAADDDEAVEVKEVFLLRGHDSGHRRRR
jgi:hypothetical protein